MMHKTNFTATLGASLAYCTFILIAYLVIVGYADVASGILSLLMIAAGVWLSPRGWHCSNMPKRIPMRPLTLWNPPIATAMPALLWD